MKEGECSWLGFHTTEEEGVSHGGSPSPNPSYVIEGLVFVLSSST